MAEEATFLKHLLACYNNSRMLLHAKNVKHLCFLINYAPENILQFVKAAILRVRHVILFEEESFYSHTCIKSCSSCFSLVQMESIFYTTCNNNNVKLSLVYVTFYPRIKQNITQPDWNYLWKCWTRAFVTRNVVNNYCKEF